MAMIKCPHCGQEVSDKAVFCPHCKERLIEEETIQCSECGAVISKSSEVCPKCGAPIEKKDTLQKVELTKIATPKINQATKKYILIGIVAVALVIGLVFGISANNKKQQAIKWQETYNSTVNRMLSDGAEAESTANMIYSVWRNTIYKTADPKTNKYTFTSYYRNNTSYTNSSSARDKYFNSDFNDSLQVYFASDEYTLSKLIINNNKDKVQKAMTELSESIPEGKENAYSTISNLYDQYLGLVNLAINPTGNLQSYTSSFNQYDNDFMNAYNKAKTFIKQ